MKIVCIYGQNHKGSTYHIAKIPWDNDMYPESWTHIYELG